MDGVIFLVAAGAVLLVILALIAVIRTLIEKPAKPEFAWGGLWWGAIYYFAHGMWRKGLIIVGLSVLISLITFGYGIPLLWLAVGIYCGKNAHADWKSVSLAKAHADAAAEVEVDFRRRELDIRRRQLDLAETKATASPATSRPESDDAETRLGRLVRLREQGLISDDEFDKKRQQILMEI